MARSQSQVGLIRRGRPRRGDWAKQRPVHGRQSGDRQVEGPRDLGDGEGPGEGSDWASDERRRTTEETGWRGPLP